MDRSNKPDHFTSVGTRSNNPYGLKTVVVPTQLMTKFLDLAAPNTNRTIETFGALCGKLVPVSFGAVKSGISSLKFAKQYVQWTLCVIR